MTLAKGVPFLETTHAGEGRHTTSQVQPALGSGLSLPLTSGGVWGGGHLRPECSPLA